MAKTVPTHPEGWKFQGACGDHLVWRAGKNDYRITYKGDVCATAEQFGLAHSKARQLWAEWEWELSQPVHQREDYSRCY